MALYNTGFIDIKAYCDCLSVVNVVVKILRKFMKNTDKNEIDQGICSWHERH